MILTDQHKGKFSHKTPMQAHIKKRILSVVTTVIIAMVIFALVVPANIVTAQGGFDVRDNNTGRDQIARIDRESTAPPAPTASCSFFDYNFSKCVIQPIVNGISVGLLTFGSWILWIGGAVLDQVLKYTLIDMKENVDTKLAVIIGELWRTFRDLANMAFIFMLLYAAINTILGRDNMRKTLTKVIIVALLLNFSFFFARVIVDVSNATTVIFYNRVLQDAPADSTIRAGGLSGAFMGKFGLTTLWDPANAQSIIDQSAGGSITKMLMMGTFGLIFMCVSAFVFFAMAALFIIRYVTILFLFILSPLAFASIALPKGSYFDKWLKSLTKQSIFAPVCMLMMWVVLRLLEVIVKTPPDLGGAIAGVSNGATGSTAAAAGSGVTIMNFAITIVAMVGVLIVAQTLGAKGASSWLKRGKNLRLSAQGYLGRGAVRTFGLDAADKYIKNKEWGNTRVGNFLREQTTGKIVKQKFGSKESVADVDKAFDKAQKKRNEYFSNHAEEDAEKRSQKIAQRNFYTSQQANIAKTSGAIEALKKKIAEAENAVTEINSRKGGIDLAELKRAQDMAAQEKKTLATLETTRDTAQKNVQAAWKGEYKIPQGPEALAQARQELAGEKQRAYRGPKIAGNIAAGLGGAVAGGAIGSIFGPVGTVVGVVGGGLRAYGAAKGMNPTRKSVIDALKKEKQNKKKKDSKEKIIKDDTDTDDLIDAILDNDEYKAAIEKKFGKKDE